MGLEPMTLRLLDRVLFLLSYQGSSAGRALSLQHKTTQHNTTHYCTNISEVVVQRAMSEGVPQEIVESRLNKCWDYTPAT